MGLAHYNLHEFRAPQCDACLSCSLMHIARWGLKSMTQHHKGYYQHTSHSQSASDWHACEQTALQRSIPAPSQAAADRPGLV